MRTTPPPEQVLIVGAGPAGLFAAAELARHGVRARLVERNPAARGRATASADLSGGCTLRSAAPIRRGASVGSLAALRHGRQPGRLPADDRLSRHSGRGPGLGALDAHLASYLVASQALTAADA